MENGENFLTDRRQFAAVMRIMKRSVSTSIDVMEMVDMTWKLTHLQGTCLVSVMNLSHFERLDDFWNRLRGSVNILIKIKVRSIFILRPFSFYLPSFDSYQLFVASRCRVGLFLGPMELFCQPGLKSPLDSYHREVIMALNRTQLSWPVVLPRSGHVFLTALRSGL